MEKTEYERQQQIAMKCKTGNEKNKINWNEKWIYFIKDKIEMSFLMVKFRLRY